MVTHPGDATIPSQIVYSQYDSMGRPVHTWNTIGKVTTTTYDNQGRVLSQTERKDDGTESITVAAGYDAKGNKRYATDGNGNITEFTYDPLDRVLTQTLAGKTTYFTYDLNGNKLTITDWLDNMYINVYDPLNRLVSRKNPFGATIERLEYNRNNLQTVSIDALGNRKVFAYDRNHRLLSTTDAGNHITGQSYDNVGNVDSETDGNGNTTLYRYDEYHRLISVTNAKNEVTSYTYDANGNLLTFTDWKGNVKTYEYNVANLVIKEIANGGRTGTAGSYTYDPARVVYYTYTANGQVLTKVDRNGETTAYTYDIHGRVLAMEAGSITVSYTYDNNGNILTMTDGTGTTTKTYDAFNRVVTKTVPGIGQSQYEYDITLGIPEGCVAEITTDPMGNAVTRIYDRAGRFYQVIADGRVTTYTYYDDGSLQKVEYNDGASEEYTYYSDNLLHTLTNKKADGTVIDTYTYTYDAAHNMLGKVDAKGTTSYTYDKLNRLLTVTEPGGKVTAYTFDAAGNRLTERVTVGSDTIVTSYIYDGQNRLTGTWTTANGQVAREVGYTYDNNGNQIITIRTEYTNGVAQTPVPVATNTYDELNQLISTITEDGTVIVNTYNGDGLRVGKAVNGELTKYLYEGSRVVLELDAMGNQTAWNIYGTNLISRLVGPASYLHV
jgi:YD repeat-containing protein